MGSPPKIVPETAIAAAEDTLIKHRAGVLWVTLNRPEHGNAIRAAAVPSLIRLLRNAQTDKSVRCLVFQGAGRHFCTGGDVHSFADALAKPAAERQADFAGRLLHVSELIEALTDFGRPIIASCRGAVAGAGMMFALAADWMLADETTQLMFAQGRIGLSADAGITYLLPRILPPRTAAQLLLGAAVLKAQEALQLGLISRLVAADELETATGELAARLASSPQLAISTSKRLIYAGSFGSRAEQLAAERQGIVNCVGDPDFAEGVEALIAKRRPSFPSSR